VRSRLDVHAKIEQARDQTVKGENHEVPRNSQATRDAGGHDQRDGPGSFRVAIGFFGTSGLLLGRVLPLVGGLTEALLTLKLVRRPHEEPRLRLRTHPCRWRQCGRDRQCRFSIRSEG